jgi:hypothetical protein
MTPKEKAKDLVRKYWDLGMIDIPKAQKCALIAVDELIKSSPQKPRSYTDTMLYWEEVKQEISNI